MWSLFKKSVPTDQEQGKFSAKDFGYQLYLKAVEMSRRPVFYTEMDVPDTIDGRFDLLSLHVSLLLDRLELTASKEYAAAAGQALFDTFFQDMDQSLREKGVGDMGVPKHMRRMLEGFNGRHTRYRLVFSAYHSGHDAAHAQEVLAEALKKNVYGEDSAADIQPLLGYVTHMLDALKTCEDKDFMTLSCDWSGMTDMYKEANNEK